MENITEINDAFNDKRKIDDFYTQSSCSLYEGEFYIIYNSKNPIDTLKRLSWTKREFEEKINFFKAKYGNDDDGLADFFTAKFNEYYAKYKEKEEETEKINYQYENAKRVVISVCSSNLSVAEYCDENLYCDMKNIKECVMLLTRRNKKVSKLILEKINEKESPEFIERMNSIKEEIQNNKDFDIVDYYLRTGLSLSDFKTVVGTFPELNKLIDRNPLNLCTSRYSDPKSFKNKNANAILSIDGITISDEDKDKIYEYMEENDIPYTQATYKAVVRKYISGELIPTKKKLI